MRVTRAEFEGVRLSIASAIAQTYISLRMSQSLYAVAKEHEASQSRVLDMVLARFEAGLASKLDVAQARTVYYSTRARVPLLMSEIDTYVNVLGVLLACGPEGLPITTPTAILGTILGCIFLNQSISIYTQIGIILLLGMAAKNAILIVEYAMDFRKEGKDIRTSAQDAGSIRLRPIMMTALAFVFGVLPMIFATGAGAASRVSLGTAVVFGMAVNAILGTLFVPNFWELLERFRVRYLAGVFAPKAPGKAPAPPAGPDKGPQT